jgi:hypothetical protein
VKPLPCIVGVADHTGWAYLLCVSTHDNVPVVIDRRKVSLIDARLPTQPYEHGTMAMREDDANALIERVTRSIASRTAAALQHVVADLAPTHTVNALTIRKAPFDTLPPTVAAVHQSYRLLCGADGVLYHQAICQAARRLGVEVHQTRRGDEIQSAAQQLGVTAETMEEFVTHTGRPLGPPWTAEHRRTYAAAIAVLARQVKGRLTVPRP